MSNRTDWTNVATEVVESTLPDLYANGSGPLVTTPSAIGALRERIAVELHNAYVAGQEGSPEVDAAPPSVVADRLIEAARKIGWWAEPDLGTPIAEVRAAARRVDGAGHLRGEQVTCPACGQDVAITQELEIEPHRVAAEVYRDVELRWSTLRANLVIALPCRLSSAPVSVASEEQVRRLVNNR